MCLLTLICAWAHVPTCPLFLEVWVKLTYRLHQIATFLLLFPKTPILSTFDAIMAIWLYGHMAIMASNSHIGIWPLWHQRWPLWVFSETPIKMWQSGEDGKSICPSCLKWEQKWSEGRFSFVFSAESLYNIASHLSLRPVPENLSNDFNFFFICSLI